ncbi:hypothetical protein KL918_003286 [Ogataea parapolymorpha]|uniref:Transporter n=1 Tax=Ogataea parapolymorpha (strain ATCC 26012 / BCRC 20466 / JCM 22074 / NRRL Y-7560 / DL-1) TaxID=871575 RepID=W1QC39_OGAPD|nr:putative transporter [Ogataea parapolymorpha DL-1]ESW97903.1 putative transporter [Ogataea parapolymorpha DL-1]KAG7867091.1 hypothetical protein KL918_003286 [Ogataea parapolymorpha]KAG7872455.1 hypothetical protein KL916_003190 [Ogataea parapolymorpha]
MEKTVDHKESVTSEVSEPDSHLVAKIKNADVTLKFMEEHDAMVGELSPDQEKALYRKLLRRVLVIVFVINLLMFFDKNAMSFSKLLGMWKETHLTQKQYSNVNSLFYAGYLVGQIPGHLIMQRVNLRLFMLAQLLCWVILMFGQLAAKDYPAIAAIRFLLGVTESVVTPCIEHTLAMFFTLKEQEVINPIFWIGTVGVGIPTGFIAYGVNHYKGDVISRWKIYWIINGGLTLLLAIWVAFDYPDNPATYKAFSIEERVHIVRRIKKQSRSSIEEKHFKMYQFSEAIRDPITWFFGLYAFTSMLANNMNFQQQVISTSLGVSNLNSTLITVAQAGYSTVAFLIGSYLLSKFKNSLCYLSVISNIPAIVGGIMAVALPWSNKIGILAGCIIVHTDGFAYILGLCWSQSSSAGYTKRLTRTTVFMIGYGVANIVAPQMWTTGPRYYAAWIVQLVVAWFFSSVLLIWIRVILSRRNKKRLAQLEFDDDGNIISKKNAFVEDGGEDRRKVDVSMLDLTDLENEEFIYPL